MTVERIVAALLLCVAIVHALPALAFFDAGRLQLLYGVQDIDANLEVLLRHRALLFLIVAGTLALGALRPGYRTLALVVGWTSVCSFIALVLRENSVNESLQRVALVDWALVVALFTATCLSVASSVHPGLPNRT